VAHHVREREGVASGSPRHGCAGVAGHDQGVRAAAGNKRARDAGVAVERVILTESEGRGA
jgi:hypothetical protein